MRPFNIFSVIQELRNPASLREFEAIQKNIAHFVLLLCFWVNGLIFVSEAVLLFWKPNLLQAVLQTLGAQILYTGVVLGSFHGYWRQMIWVPLLLAIHTASTGIAVMGMNSSLWTVYLLVVVIAQVTLSLKGLLFAILFSVIGFNLANFGPVGKRIGASVINQYDQFMPFAISVASILLICIIIYFFTRIHFASTRVMESSLKNMRDLGRSLVSEMREKEQAQSKLSQWTIELEQQVREKTVEITHAMEDAKAANEAKSAFLANMSHEIRTPMNAVHSLSEMLLGTSLSEEQQEMVGLVTQSSHHLMEIIDNILDFSKIESGRLDLEEVFFNPVTQVQGLYQLMKPKADEKKLVFEYTIQKAPSTCFVGDPVRINQILINLLSNAIKFTDHGTVHFEADFTMTNGMVRYQVCDTGIGISSEQYKTLFSPFTQADISTTRRFGGTGLGLSISKRLTDAMKGKLFWTENSAGGSVFTLELPLTISECGFEHDQTRLDSLVVDGVEPVPRHILVVEDNKVNQKVICKLLEKIGVLQIECCENGAEAIDILQKHSFDVVLMDCQMPVMDGFEATRRIRQQLKLGDLPVIALTANIMADSMRKCEEAGMNGFISKPIQRKLLRKILSRYA